MPPPNAKTLMALGLGATLLLAATLSPAEARDKVQQSDMQDYCKHRAAEKLGVRARDVLTLPVEKDSRDYVVYGQYPTRGSDVTTFSCAFGSNRKFDDVRIDEAGGRGRGDEVVARGDMGRYCAGEASAAFGVRPQDILTLPVERDGAGYVVYGQYPPDGRHVTLFECHYDGSGAFDTVYRN
jgi:hypothetical protein